MEVISARNHGSSNAITSTTYTGDSKNLTWLYYYYYYY